MRAGAAEGVLVVGAVDVDVAGKSIYAGAGIDPVFEAAQPEDAAGDEVPFGRGQAGVDFAGGAAALKDHAAGGAGAVLFSDFMEAPGCAEGILDAAGGGGADGDGVGAGRGIGGVEAEKLLDEVGVEDHFGGLDGGALTSRHEAASQFIEEIPWHTVWASWVRPGRSVKSC